MMKKKKGTLEKKLKAYSAAAAAGTLLLAPSAQAAVQYSGPQNLVVNSGASQNVDLNSDGFGDFIFSYSGDSTTHKLLMDFVTTGSLGGTGVIKQGPFPSNAANLPSNYLIRNTVIYPPYTWSNNPATLAGYFDGSSYGNFYNTSGYIGVRFISVCGTTFGWVQFQSSSNASQGTIIDWAYEDTCSPILAGDVGAPAVSVPTLNQWGLLILIALLAGAGTLMLKKQEESS